MRSDLWRASPAGTGARLALTAVLAGALAGCGASRVQIVAYHEHAQPRTIHVTLRDGVYRLGPSGDIYAAAHSRTSSAAGWAVEYLAVHVFWTPVPGKTFAESSTTDAVVRYVVANESGSATYTGTGFAFPEEQWGGLRIDLESAWLQLESKSGDIPDVLGRARLTGSLEVRRDDAAAAHLERDVELAAFRVAGVAPTEQ